jgi:hypothetical protein
VPTVPSIRDRCTDPHVAVFAFEYQHASRPIESRDRTPMGTPGRCPSLEHLHDRLQHTSHRTARRPFTPVKHGQITSGHDLITANLGQAATKLDDGTIEFSAARSVAVTRR